MASPIVAQAIHDQHEVIAWCAVFIAVATVAASLRWYARWQSRSGKNNRKWMGWDDVLLVPALACTIVLGACWISEFRALISSYTTSPTGPNAEHLAVTAAKSGWLGSSFYPLASGFPKLSICALYLRIFTGRWTRIITWVMVAFLTANMLAFFFAQIFLCNPPSYFWTTFAISTTNAGLHKGKCINLEAVILAINPPHIASDIVLLILPLPTVWKLQMSIGRKVGLAITFMSASIGLAGSLARWLIYLTKQGNTSTEVSKIQSILTMLEPTMYLIAACLPPMRSLLAQMWTSDRIRTPLSWTLSKVTLLRQPSAASTARDFPHRLRRKVSKGNPSEEGLRHQVSHEQFTHGRHEPMAGVDNRSWFTARSSAEEGRATGWPLPVPERTASAV